LVNISSSKYFIIKSFIPVEFAALLDLSFTSSPIILEIKTTGKALSL
jgi:hypothetical protein